jgi:DNA-binding NtrC family response regulator
MQPIFPVAVIDDDQEMLRVLARFLEKHGIDCETFNDPRKAVVAFSDRRFSVIVSDVQMPGMSGHELLEQAKHLQQGAVVIMITGFGSVKSAVQAMRNGAFDYISKPFDYDEFLTVLQKAIQQHALQAEVSELRRSVQNRYAFGSIIGKGAGMQKVFDVIGRIAHTRTNILVVGESGTGKELVSRAIHYAGPRKDAPFIAINCGALPETLLESELFGHERGAYTGAVTRERGLLVSADTGTIFLDEIADMPLAMQTKFLRVLEDWEVRAVGSSTVRKIDVRVISASKTDLSKCVEAGTFREDLYYRLNVVTLLLPPLRERPEDIPLLIAHLLRRAAAEHHRETPALSREAMDALLRFPWPGNVRELEHVIERSMILAEGDEVGLRDLPPHIATAAGQSAAGADGYPLTTTLEEVERQHIRRVLEHVEWKRSLAADTLGINRRTLYRKIQEYGIEEP